MSGKSRIEIFSTGCSAREKAIELVNQIVCHLCEVSVLDMKDVGVAERAQKLGIRSIPSIVIDGRLADCCAETEPDEAVLRIAGLGQPMK